MQKSMMLNKTKQNSLEDINGLLKTIRFLSIFIIVIVSAFLFVLIGAVLNQTAVSANGGKMPVYNSYGEDDQHFGFDNKEDVKHFYLTDIIPIGDYALSIGDILLFSGGLMYAILVIFSLINLRMLIKYNRIIREYKAITRFLKYKPLYNYGNKPDN